MGKIFEYELYRETKISNKHKIRSQLNGTKHSIERHILKGQKIPTDGDDVKKTKSLYPGLKNKLE